MRPRRSVRARARRSPPVLDAKAAKLVAFDLLARRAWSTRELSRRLRGRGAPEDVARTVVTELEARGYVNDEAFARGWAQSRAEGRRVGSMRLRRELAVILARGQTIDQVRLDFTSLFQSGSFVKVRQARPVDRSNY